MTSAASVGAGERLRLFCALRLPDEVVHALEAWQPRALADGGRLVARANLHVTLAFLGGRPAEELEIVVRDLRAAAQAAGPIRLLLRGYRETRSVGMLTFTDEDGHASALAEGLHDRLERAGVYEREKRPWLPHVTVLRFQRPPRLRPELPQLGPVSPSEAAVYSSVLRPSGAQYEVLESVPLGG